MNYYCFNYSIKGIMSFLPMFISVCAPNKHKAITGAKKYLEIKYRRPATVYLKNYGKEACCKGALKSDPTKFRPEHIVVK